MPEAITGLILAGGLGRRMGGIDKGLRLFRNEPMVAHAIRRLRGQVDRLLINSNQNLPAYAALGFPVIEDPAIAGVEAYAGPLAGLYAGLSCATTPLLVSVPCDSPFFPLDFVAKLSTELTRTQSEAAVVETANGLQPVFMLCRRELTQSLADYLTRGGRKIDAWLSELKLVPVYFDDQASFTNINTIAELSQYE